MTLLRTICGQIDDHSRGGAMPRLGRCGHRSGRMSPLYGQVQDPGGANTLSRGFTHSISRGYSLADQYRSRRHSVGNRPELLPSHSKISFSNGSNRSEGAVAIVRNTVGEIRNV